MMVISHHLFVLAPLLKAVGSFSAYIRTIDHGVTMMLCTNEIIYTASRHADTAFSLMLHVFSFSSEYHTAWRLTRTVLLKRRAIGSDKLSHIHVDLKILLLRVYYLYSIDHSLYR